MNPEVAEAIVILNILLSFCASLAFFLAGDWKHGLYWALGGAIGGVATFLLA